MSFINSLDISASALSAQRLRSDIIMQNIANQDTYNTSPDGDPYCRQLVVLSEKKKALKNIELIEVNSLRNR